VERSFGLSYQHIRSIARLVAFCRGVASWRNMARARTSYEWPAAEVEESPACEKAMKYVDAAVGTPSKTTACCGL